MKVILIKEVKGVGHAYEVADVADGYALHFLIPKKLAVSATPLALKEAESHRRKSAERAALDTALVAQNIASLAEAKITIAAKVNEKGHLYDAIDAADIMEAARAQAHIDLPEDAIKLEKPIKELGTFTIPISHHEAFGSFSITVEAE
ncbi:50S ribosomal protein L9 [Patescibacteria group bacterium]|nr:50S ribosomal protein L9 [Patescibacteria group bacterium]